MKAEDLYPRAEQNDHYTPLKIGVGEKKTKKTTPNL